MQPREGDIPNLVPFILLSFTLKKNFAKQTMKSLQLCGCVVLVFLLNTKCCCRGILAYLTILYPFVHRMLCLKQWTRRFTPQHFHCCCLE